MIIVCGSRASDQSVWAYNDDGTFAWSFDTGGTAYYASVDADGRILIGCNPVDLGDGYGAANLRFLNSAGVQTNAMAMPGSTSFVYSVNMDSQGNYYVASYRKLHRYDSNWNFVSEIKTGYYIVSCCFDNDDNVYYAYKEYSTASAGGHVEKQDPLGSIVWTTPLDTDLKIAAEVVKLVDSDIVVCTKTDNSIIKRLSEVDGSEVWRVIGEVNNLSARVPTSFVNPKDKFLYIAGPINLYTVDPDNGDVTAYPHYLPYTYSLIPKLATIYSDGIPLTENAIIYPHEGNAAAGVRCMLSFFNIDRQEHVHLGTLSAVPAVQLYGSTYTEDSQLDLAPDKLILESYTGEDSTNDFQSGRWFAQIFQVDEFNEVTSVIFRHKLVNSTYTVELQSVTGGVPSGEVLASVSEVTGSDSINYHGRVYRFSTPVLLTPGVDYAIVLSSDSDFFTSIVSSVTDLYAHKTYYSEDSGSSWNELSEESLFFIVQGKPGLKPGLPGKPTNPNPTDGDIGTDFSDYTLSWDTGGNTDTYDVYIGSSVGGLVKISSAQIGTSLLIPEEYRFAKTVGTWYWRVDATNFAGTAAGDVWSFSPYWLPEIVDQSQDQIKGKGAQVDLFVDVVAQPMPSEWAVPVSPVVDDNWSDPSLAFDWDADTYAYRDVAPGGGGAGWDSVWLTFELRSAISINGFRFNVRNGGLGDISGCEVQLFFDGEWQSVYGLYPELAYRGTDFPDHDWQTVLASYSKEVSAARIKFANTSNFSYKEASVYGFQFHLTAVPYQWKKNGTSIGGAVSDTYSFFADTTAIYTCEVTNVVGSVTSADIVITVADAHVTYNILNMQLDIDRS